MRKTGILISLVLLAGLVVGSDHVDASASKKVIICHHPPGNPANTQTISIGEAATAAHLQHGDQIGECQSGCQANASICDDGDACTSDACLSSGQCQHNPVNCDDGNPCTTNVCLAVLGCVSLPSDGVACDDANACTTGDVCLAMVCVGSPVSGCCSRDSQCEDGDRCTVNSCVEGVCHSLASDCSVADKCLAGFCDPANGLCSTTPADCSDSNLCTDDFCDPTIGCFSQPTNQPPESVEVTCADGADNDCDGLVDSQDPDCPKYFLSCGEPVCRGWSPKNVPGCTSEQAGDSCSPAGRMCDPHDNCNRILICTNVDPTQNGCPL